MGLGLSTGGASSDRTPYVKYDARAGRWFRVDRSQSAGGEWVTDSVDVTNGFSFVADMANIQVGWINYSDQGPQKIMVKLGEPMPARPDGVNDKGKAAFRQGFNLMMALPKNLGGGVREFNSNAGCVIEAMDDLHTVYSAAPEAAQGKLPVVASPSAVPVKSGQSTNYKPQFQITGWVDRPAGLGAQAPTTAKPTATATPPSTGSTQAPPPAARQAPQPAAMDASDFG